MRGVCVRDCAFVCVYQHLAMHGAPGTTHIFNETGINAYARHIRRGALPTRQETAATQPLRELTRASASLR